MTPGSTYRPARLQPPCLGREPKLGLRQLKLPDFDKEFEIHFDVSDFAIGGIDPRLGGREPRLGL
jgi:hypothetical protein